MSDPDLCQDLEEEGRDTLGPLALIEGPEMEAQIACMEAMVKRPEMFVSGFDGDDQGIQGPANPDSPGERFLLAAEEGDVERMKEIMEEDKSVISYRDEDGYTAVHRAAQNEHSSLILFLVENGAQVDAKTDDGWTPLHSACHWNCYKAARELINCFANVNSRTNGDNTPLHVASNQQSKECMIILLTNPDIDVKVKNTSGDTALDLARRVGTLGYLFDTPLES